MTADTCGETLLVETPDGKTVRCCTLASHLVDEQHRTRFRNTDLTWTHGLARVRVETPTTVERQPSLV